MRSLFCHIIIVVLLGQLLGCKNNKYISKEDSVVDTILQPTVFYPEQFDEQGRLYYYVKVFGVLKYFLSEEKQDVNALFLQRYQDVKESPDKETFNQQIQQIIFALHPKLDLDLSNNTGVDWVNDTAYFTQTTAQYISAVEHLFRTRKKKSCSVTQNHLGIVEITPPKDTSFLNDSLPKEAVRLWTMADYWNYINYFWVYKNLMDNNWDSVLYVSIPHFINAQNRREYALSIYKFIAYTDDTHVYFSKADTFIAGCYVPNVRLVKIDSFFVVKKHRTNRTLIPSDTMLHVGDIIHSINGIDLYTYYDSLKHYFAASNPWTKVRKVAPYTIALFSKDNNEVVISRKGIKDTLNMFFSHYMDYANYEYDGYDRFQNEVTVKSVHGIGYIHIHYLFPSNLRKNLQALQQYDNIIIDIRGYPNVFLKLTNNVLPFRTNFFCSIYPDIIDIGKIRLNRGYTVGLKNCLKNKSIVILVDEETQSQAEFLVMALQQLPNVRVIGTPTAGADGNVLYFTFAGNIQTTLSGIGIVYPNGKQTQRCGIKIDYLVNPTIEDYINTQDPVLEYAIQYFK